MTQRRIDWSRANGMWGVYTDSEIARVTGAALSTVAVFRSKHFIIIGRRKKSRRKSAPLTV